MFADKDIALTVREHMSNAIWMITASGLTSPVTEASEDEQQSYNQAISKICDAITNEILNPIFEKHPILMEHRNIRYERQHFVREIDS
jgi:hypothetical protein